MCSGTDGITTDICSTRSLDEYVNDSDEKGSSIREYYELENGAGEVRVYK